MSPRGRMDDDATEVRIDALEALVERQEGRIRELEEALGMTFLAPIEFRLTPHESGVLGVLLARDLCTKRTIMTALYGGRIDAEPEIKIVDVFVCKLRKKIAPFGVTIETRWGVGYWMTAKAKAAVMSMLPPSQVAA